MHTQRHTTSWICCHMLTYASIREDPRICQHGPLVRSFVCPSVRPSVGPIGSMIYENTWNPVESFEYYEILWNPLGSYELPWNPMRSYGIFWNPESCEILWNPAESSGNLLKSYGNICGAHKNTYPHAIWNAALWNLMKSHEILWHPMKSNEIL